MDIFYVPLMEIDILKVSQATAFIANKQNQIIIESLMVFWCNSKRASVIDIYTQSAVRSSMHVLVIFY